MVRHAAVTFLASRTSLGVVDSEFTELVRLFHRIPYCATFGVSCSGHCQDIDADSFWPILYGHLNIIVFPAVPHIAELLKLLMENISKFSDASFQKIDHSFGPSKESKLEIWEIRIGDNGCLKPLGDEWYCDYVNIQGNEALFRASRDRHKQLRLFWKALEQEVLSFCTEQNFRRFALDKRVKELMEEWR